MKDDPFPMYEDLLAYLKELPATWYPALILEMVDAAYRKRGVFVPDGASRLVAQHEAQKKKQGPDGYTKEKE